MFTWMGFSGMAEQPVILAARKIQYNAGVIFCLYNVFVISELRMLTVGEHLAGLLNFVI